MDKLFLVAQAAQVNNPLEDTSVLDMVFGFVKALTIAAMPLVVLAIMAAGVLLILARGNKDTLKENKKLIIKIALSALVAISILFIARLIINLLSSIYNAF